MTPGWSSTDGSVSCVDCCVEGERPLGADEVVVSFGATASPSTEVEGEVALEICIGDPPVTPEGELARFSLGDSGRLKSARNRSRFLAFPLGILK